jgi:hypothetical protein
MTPSSRITLPSGVWIDGTHVREVRLRAVGSADEVLILESRDAMAPCRRATTVLARCLEGPFEPLALARALTIGDREALVLHLRRLTVGDRISATLRCPDRECAKPMDLTLSVTELLLPPYAHPAPSHELHRRAGRHSWALRFHLPTGAEQEEAVDAALESEERGLRLLLSRCIEKATSGGCPADIGTLPDELRDALSACLAELDPQAELLLELGCPECGRRFTTLFDSSGFFLQELDARAERLVREIHVLARHYHWSEREILDLPPRRRARYLELVGGSAALPSGYQR